MNVESEIRAELARRGMTQRELSEATGIPWARLNSKLNHHRGGLRVRELRAISAALNIETSELVRRAERESEEKPVAAATATGE